MEENITGAATAQYPFSYPTEGEKFRFAYDRALWLTATAVPSQPSSDQVHAEPSFYLRYQPSAESGSGDLQMPVANGGLDSGARGRGENGTGDAQYPFNDATKSKVSSFAYNGIMILGT
jgi:hypothetical protein